MHFLRIKQSVLVVGLVVAALGSVNLQAQYPDIGVRWVGSTPLLTLHTGGPVDVRSLLVAIATKLKVPLELASGVPDILDGATVPVQVTEMPGSDLVQHLAGAYGLSGDLYAESIRLSPLPKEDSPEVSEYARNRAISAWNRASVQREEGTTDALYNMAVLHYAGQEYAQAISLFDRFATRMPKDARAPRALLLAAWSAHRDQREDTAVVFLDRLVRGYQDIPEIMESHLLMARVQMRRKKYDEGHVRLQRVINNAEDKRLQALGRVLKAELWWRAGNPKAALEALAEFEIEERREFPDLQRRLPLFTGLCLSANEQNERAIVHFQLALVQGDRLQKTRAALALARIWLKQGRHFTALESVKKALRQEPDGPLLIEAKLLEAELSGRIGLTQRAIAAYFNILKMPNTGEAVQLHAFEQVGEIMLKRRDFSGAIALYQGLTAREGYEGIARVQVAKARMGLKEWRKALTVLEEIPAGAPRINSGEIARLRGACFTKLGEHTKAALALSADQDLNSRTSPAKGQTNDEEGAK